MAVNTWTALASGVSFAAGKNMLAILNGGSRVLRIRRIGLLNIQTAAVSGVICQIDVRRYTGAGLASPTAVTPVAHDSSNSALDTVTIGYAGTPSGTSTVLRRVIWSSDEPAFSAALNDEWECLVPLNIIWDAGYGDSSVQALVLRTNQMLSVYNVSGAAGLVDVWIELTDETT